MFFAEACQDILSRRVELKDLLDECSSGESLHTSISKGYLSLVWLDISSISTT